MGLSLPDLTALCDNYTLTSDAQPRPARRGGTVEKSGEHAMSWSSRGAVLGTVTLLGILSLQLAQAQPGKLRPPIIRDPDGRPIVKPPVPGEGDLYGISLPTEEDLKRRIREINVLI